MSRIFRPRTIMMMVVLLALAAVSYGFAAGLTVNMGFVGQGTDTIADDTVAVDWVLDTTDPTQNPVACLDFTTATTLTSVYLSVVDGSSNPLGTSPTYISCDVTTLATCGGTYEAECDLADFTANVPVSSIYGVDIVAGE